MGVPCRKLRSGPAMDTGHFHGIVAVFDFGCVAGVGQLVGSCGQCRDIAVTGWVIGQVDENIVVARLRRLRFTVRMGAGPRTKGFGDRGPRGKDRSAESELPGIGDRNGSRGCLCRSVYSCGMVTALVRSIGSRGRQNARAAINPVKRSSTSVRVRGPLRSSSCCSNILLARCSTACRCHRLPRQPVSGPAAAGRPVPTTQRYSRAGYI